MPATATTDEVQQISSNVQQLETAIKDAQTKLTKEPSSDGRNSALQMLAQKLSFLDQVKGALGAAAGPAGAAGAAGQISPDLVRSLREKIKQNIQWLVQLVKELAGLIRDIIEGVISIFETLVSELAPIFERHTGTAKATPAGNRTYQLAGSTANVRLQCNSVFQSRGFPAQSAALSGSWTATVVAAGTAADGSQGYRVTQFSSAPGAVSIGPAKLTGVTQVLDVEYPSIFTVTDQGQVSGVLYTRFLISNWPGDHLGIPALSTITGQLAGETLNYSAVGEDFCFLRQFIAVSAPAAGTPPRLPVTIAPLTVKNSAGVSSAFSVPHLVGTMTMQETPPAVAKLVAQAVVKTAPVQAPIATSALRRVTDLASTNPFEGPVSEILTAPEA